jgi:hypothetical protein
VQLAIFSARVSTAPIDVAVTHLLSCITDRFSPTIYTSTLKMVAASSSDKLANIYRTTRLRIPEGGNLHIEHIFD